MNTYSATPSVVAVVNGIPNACKNSDCTYTFLTNVPKVMTASLAGSTLSLTLSDPTNINANLKKVTVTLDGQPCTIVDLNKTMTNFTCTLPSNPDGSAILRAGSYFPVVKIDPVGYIDVDSNVTAINVPFTVIAAISDYSIGNGGINIKLTGTGFPLTA